MRVRSSFAGQEYEKTEEKGVKRKKNVNKEFWKLREMRNGFIYRMYLIKILLGSIPADRSNGKAEEDGDFHGKNCLESETMRKR